MPRQKKPKKAINGQGNLRKLKSGKWEYRYVMPTRKPDGSLDRRSKTAATGEQAFAIGQADIAEAKNMLAAISAPRPTKANPDITISELFERWWPIHTRSVRDTTLSTDKFTRQRITESLGTMPVKDVRPSQINAHTEKQLSAGLSDNTAGKDRSMLYQLFSYAVEEEITDRNPVIKKSIGKPRDTTLAVDRKDAYSPDEVGKMLDAHARLSAFRGSRGLSPALIQAADATIVWLFSGIREEELLFLSADIVDASGGSMSIIGALNIVGGKSVPGPTKSIAALRRAEVSQVAQPILAAMKEHAKNGQLLHSRNHQSKFYGASAFRDAYYAFVQSIEGIRVLPPNCCRHTHATMLAAVGVPPALIQYQMGHNDYQLTASIYTHVKLYMSPEAIKKIKGWGVGEFYWGSKPEALEMVGDEGPKEAKEATRLEMKGEEMDKKKTPEPA